jgi:hypothetical protein
MLAVSVSVLPSTSVSDDLFRVTIKTLTVLTLTLQEAERPLPSVDAALIRV